jgi:hypothetical protein
MPAVLDGFGHDCIPSISCHKHGFEKVNFVYIVFISLVKLNGSKAISTAVVSLDTTNDSSIAGLNKRCEIWLEIFKADILRFVFDKMTRKVVNEHNDIVTSISHAYVKSFNPPANEFLLKFLFKKKSGVDKLFEKLCCHPGFFVVLIIKSSFFWRYLLEAAGVLRFPDVK